MDLAHIVQSLNKVTAIPSFSLPGFIVPPPQLDTGVAENVMLHSRDEQSILIVSYADLKACIDATFTQLTSAPNLDT